MSTSGRLAGKRAIVTGSAQGIGRAIALRPAQEGAVATASNKATLADPAKVAELIAVLPLGRVGQPEEIAGLAAYLAPDEAACVTGATYFSEGGMIRHAYGSARRPIEQTQSGLGRQ